MVWWEVTLVFLEVTVAFLEVTVVHVCLGTADGGRVEAGGRAALAGGGGGAVVWIILSRESLSRSATLVVSVATFSTRAGLLY